MSKSIRNKMIAILLFVASICMVLFVAMGTTNVAFAVTRYEAENATVTKGTVKLLSGEGSYAVGASGTGFVGMNSEDGAKVTFTVNVSEAGLYEMTIKYATGFQGSEIPTVNVYRGEVFQGWIKCPFTTGSGWGGFNTANPVTCYIGLNSGNNTIVIERSQYCVELDYIEIGSKVGAYQNSMVDITGTKYEAEDGTVTDCNKKSGNDGYALGVSGTGFVADIDSGTSAVTFNVTVASTGTYELFVKFASGSDSTATFLVSANGGTAKSVELKQRNGWGSFDSTQAGFTTIELGATTSTIKVQKGDYNGQIDYIVIGSKVGGSSSSEEDPPTSSSKIEAESGTLVGNATIKLLSGDGSYAVGASGTGFVGGIDNDGDGVTFTVTASQEGEYNFNIKCTSGSDGNPTIKIQVNGVNYGVATLTTRNGWGAFDSTPVIATKVSLNEGSNIVTLLKGAYNVELDYVELGSRIGDKKVHNFSSITPPSGQTLYEAEDAGVTCSEKKLYMLGTSADYASGVSGCGFIGLNDYGAIQFVTTVATEGNYNIYIKYASGSDGVTLKLYNKIGLYSTLTFTSDMCKGWGAFSTTDIYQTTISLQKNDIVTIGQSVNFAEIDYIIIGSRVGDYVVGNGASVASGFTRYEAESASLLNTYTSRDGSGYSGPAYATGFTDATYGVEFALTTTTEGTYTIKVHYATASSTSMTLYAGEYGSRNQSYGSKDITSTGSLSTFTNSSIVTYSVGLKSGTNFIKIFGANLSIDYIDVSTTNTAYVDGTNVNPTPSADDEYTINFNGNGATSGTMTAEIAKIGENVTLTQNAFSKTNMEFKGWALSETGAVVFTDGQTVSDLSVTYGENITLYAVWGQATYIIAYDGNGATSGSMLNQYVNVGEDANLTTNAFVKANNTFKGWATTENGEVTYTDGQQIKDIASKDVTITLYAVWEQDTYTIAFNNNTGVGEMANLTCNCGENVNITMNTFTKEGYKFIGWAESDSGEVVYTNGQQVKDLVLKGETKTLYAIWEEVVVPSNSYTLKYNGNGATSGAMVDEFPEIGQSFTLTACGYAKTGYTFKGWATTKSGEVVYTDGATITTDLASKDEVATLYAIWEEVKTPEPSGDTYTITFVGNGADNSTLIKVDVNVGETIKLRANTYTRANFKFMGWTTSANGVVIYTDEQEVKDLAEAGKNISLYAVWKEATEDNGGSTNSGSSCGMATGYDGLAVLFVAMAGFAVVKLALKKKEQ